MRIAVLGDSFVEGYSVPLEHTFSRRLEKRLDRPDRRVEVYNLGVGGYGTLQAYLNYLQVRHDLAPDLVLLGFLPANDVRNNSARLEAALHGGSDHYKVRARPFLRPGAGFEVRAPDLSGPPLHPVRPWWKRTALWALARDAAIALGGTRGGASDVGAWLGAYSCESSPDYEAAWATTERIVGRLRHEVDADGRNLLAFFVPALQDLGPDYLDRAARRSGDPLCFDHNLAAVRSRALFSRADVPLIDLQPAFEAAATRGDSTHYEVRDHHWNAAGHALAAGLVAQRLEDDGVLDRLRTAP